MQRVNTLESLLEKTEQELIIIMNNNPNVRDEEIRRLVKSIVNLNKCRQLIINGDYSEKIKLMDLYWDSWDRHHHNRSTGTINHQIGVSPRANHRVTPNSTVVTKYQQQSYYHSTVRNSCQIGSGSSSGIADGTDILSPLSDSNNSSSGGNINIISPEDYSNSTITPPSPKSPLPQIPGSPGIIIVQQQQQQIYNVGKNSSGSSSSKTNGGSSDGGVVGFPTTPPPKKKHQTLIQVNNQQNSNTLNNNYDPQSLTKSKSHESQLINTNPSNQQSSLLMNGSVIGADQDLISSNMATTTNTPASSSGTMESLTGGVGGCVDDDNSLILQIPNSPRTPTIITSQPTINTSHPTRSMGHMISHRFTKKFKVMGTCDLCQKQMFFGLKCKECKYRCHKDCEVHVPPSCGLPQEFIDEFKKSLQQQQNSGVSGGSDHYGISTSPNMIRSSNFLSSSSSSSGGGGGGVGIGGGGHRKLLTKTTNQTNHQQSTIGGNQYGHESSSPGSSCNSSSPSSPALLLVQQQMQQQQHHIHHQQHHIQHSSQSSHHYQQPQQQSYQYQQIKVTQFNFDDINQSSQIGGLGVNQDSNSQMSNDTFQKPTDNNLLIIPTHYGHHHHSHHHHTLHRPSQLSQQQLDEQDEQEDVINELDDKIISISSTSTSIDSDIRTPIRLDSQEERDNINWPRQNSLSLKEWDIPYDDLHLLEKIGKGRFGTVHRALWHGDVAVKLLKEDYLDDERTLEAFKLEVATFKKTRHENVVLFMGACMKPPRLAIVTSLCKGNTLYTHIHLRKDKFNLNRTTLVAQQISQGMGYLHARGIVHKDLKTKNIFLENGKVIITDFGLFSATKLCYCEYGLGIPQGWLCYLAPELIRGLKPFRPTDDDLPFSKTSDVYAFGTVWYELLCGEFPFKSQSQEAIIYQVGRGMKQTLANLQASRDVKDILMLCWSFQADDRPDFAKLLILLERLPKKRLARSPSHPVQLSRSAESVF